MDDVNDAVILAGGRGTRMLPSSLFVPKETMPLVDIPLINHLIWEAAKAGATRVHLVLSDRKYGILKDFINEGLLFGEEVRPDLPREALSLGLEGVEIIPHIQTNPGGVGDAIYTAIDSVDGPFLVILGDMLLMDSHVGPVHSGTDYASSASSKLVKMFTNSGLPVVGVCQVNHYEISNYGVVEISDGNIVRIEEKPDVDSAPSEFILCGRYIFPRNMKQIFEKYPLSDFGELQSIQILNHLIKNGGLRAVKLDQFRLYDGGNPLSWLKSQIDHALRRQDLRSELGAWIENRISEVEF